MDHSREFFERAHEGSATPARETGWLARLHRLLSRYELHRTDAVAALVPASSTVLDVGCGDGRLLEAAAGRQARGAGVDLSAQAVLGARRRLAAAGLRAVALAVADLDRGLPFRDATFDAVTCVSVLPHVWDPFAAIAEMRRVLRPSGVLILQVANLAFLPRRLALLAGHLPRVSVAPGWDGGHLHAFTLGSVSHLLRGSGFVVEAVTGSGVLAAWRRAWPSLLSGDLILVGRRDRSDPDGPPPSGLPSAMNS
jgi:methionine biosynthesis protein MetW